jgi:hypothetical protein
MHAQVIPSDFRAPSPRHDCLHDVECEIPGEPVPLFVSQDARELDGHSYHKRYSANQASDLLSDFDLRILHGVHAPRRRGMRKWMEGLMRPDHIIRRKASIIPVYLQGEVGMLG